MSSVSELGLGGQWNDRPYSDLDENDQQIAFMMSAQTGWSVDTLQKYCQRYGSLRYATFSLAPKDWPEQIRERAGTLEDWEQVRLVGSVAVRSVPFSQQLELIVDEVVPEDL